MLDKRSPSSLMLNLILDTVSLNDYILLNPLLYDDNFGHSWGDVASSLFPESWYKCDSAEYALPYMDALNLNSTAWSSPVTCSCLPFFLNFLGGAQKPREYGECQMLQLDRYRSLDVSIDHSKRFAADISNTMSWFRTFASCCHPWYIFQVIFLNHIVEQRLQKTKVFIMVVKIQSIKVMLLPSYTPLVDFITLCFITASVSLCICWWSISTSLIFIVNSCVEVECSAIVFGSNRSIDLKVSFCRQGMIGK